MVAEQQQRWPHLHDSRSIADTVQHGQWAGPQYGQGVGPHELEVAAQVFLEFVSSPQGVGCPESGRVAWRWPGTAAWHCQGGRSWNARSLESGCGQTHSGVWSWLGV